MIPRIKKFFKNLSFRKVFKLGIVAFVYIVVFDWYVTFSVRNYIFSNLESVIPQKVGVLLGTSKFMQDGTINSFYQNRILATSELYNNGKIQNVLISGDNAHKSYNEPEMMKNDLVDRGIPENKIYLDYAGFRTLDSVVRAKEVFGQDSFLVISQDFHSERAVYLGRSFGIDVYGYVAKSVGFNMWARELLARQKMFLDLLFGANPKFLGDKIQIE